MNGSILEFKHNLHGTRYGGKIYVDGGKEFFFHKNDLSNCTIYQLKEGDVVEFDIGSYEGRTQATNVRMKY